MNPIDLKEHIATSDAFSPDERVFLLQAINLKIALGGEDEVHAPQNTLGRVHCLHAYLSVDDGGEGLCGMQIVGLGPNVPLAFADPNTATRVKPLVRALASKTNKVIRLVKFSGREDIEIIHP